MVSLSCSIYGPIPQPGLEPGSSVLGVQSLSHWTTREVPDSCFKTIPLAVEWVGGAGISYGVDLEKKVRTGCMRKQLELECDRENEQTGLPI